MGNFYTHGHFDHIQGTKALSELYHCKTFIGINDAPLLKEQAKLNMAHPHHNDMFPTRKRQIDGDEFAFVTPGTWEPFLDKQAASFEHFLATSS